MMQDAGDTAKAPSDTSSQPSILNIKSMETNTAMKVESDILEPLTFSQSECVFELQPKGFLHPGSAISLALDVNSGVDRAFPFVNVGIHSLVRRAVLRTTAGRVINDTDDWNHLQSLRSLFVNNSTNKEREQYLTGRSVDYDLYYNVGSDVSAESYGLGNGMERNDIPGVHQGLSVQPTLLNGAEPEFQLKLHDLFNYCRAGNQLPLFLLPDERIQVVLFWSDEAKHRLCLSKEDEGSSPASFTISRRSCKFIADYTSYDNKIMDSFRGEFAKGLTFAYTDYLLSKQSVSEAQAVNNVRNVGGNGMMVDNVFFAMTRDDLGDTELLGKYTAETPSVLSGAGKTDRELLSTNLFINSEFLYPQTLTNPARQFHNLKESARMVPFVSRAMYSGQGDEALSNEQRDSFEGRAQADELVGAFFHQGFRTEGLSTRIDNRGIDLHMSGTFDTSNYNQRVWLDVKRYVVISDGHLETYFV